MNLIPATVLTGFLGSGKSTLLRRILTEAHGHRIAVIENEFGEENIDSEIIVSGGSEQIIQLSNGCVCCSIRDDLRATLWDLAERRNRGEIDFEQVMIETTGLADPGPIAQTFFLDDQIMARYRPDGILTMVDAKHAMDQLDKRFEARRQVGFADRLFLSKADTVSKMEIDLLSARLGQMNARAPQTQVHFGNVPISEVFNLGGFNLNEDIFAAVDADSTHDCSTAGQHSHHHDDVTSFLFRSERPFHRGRFGQFMNALVNGFGSRLLRYKGILHMQGMEQKVVFQGVHQLTSHDVGGAWPQDEARISRLVFIGIELPREMILRSLEQCLV